MERWKRQGEKGKNKNRKMTVWQRVGQTVEIGDAFMEPVLMAQVGTRWEGTATKNTGCSWCTLPLQLAHTGFRQDRATTTANVPFDSTSKVLLMTHINKAGLNDHDTVV